MSTISQSSIKINHVIMPAISTLNILSDMCAICRENVIDKCIKCMDDPNSKCYSVIGTCLHAYHYCCVSQYTKGYSLTQKCPTCNNKWCMQKRNDNIAPTTSTITTIKKKTKIVEAETPEPEIDDEENDN
jgi:hypothetical protein